MLTVAELAEILDEYLEDYPDMEVRLATQPRWPFEYGVDRVEVVAVEDRESFKRPAEEKQVLYLSESHQIGYLPTPAKEALGW